MGLSHEGRFSGSLHNFMEVNSISLEVPMIPWRKLMKASIEVARRFHVIYILTIIFHHHLTF